MSRSTSRCKNVPITTIHRKRRELIRLSGSWEPVRRKHRAGQTRVDSWTGMGVSPWRVSFDKTIFARNCSHLILACTHPTSPQRSFGIPCVRSDHTLELKVEQRQVSFVQPTQPQGLSSACLSCWGFQTMSLRKVDSREL